MPDHTTKPATDGTVAVFEQISDAAFARRSPKTPERQRVPTRMWSPARSGRSPDSRPVAGGLTAPAGLAGRL